jgi:hypothetical protein
VISVLPRYAHLFAMTDGIGLFEHALLTSPRPEHGYCVDDVARGLVVLCRAESGEAGDGAYPRSDRTSTGEEIAEAAGRREQLAWAYLAFVRQAQQADGRIVNRRDTNGAWHGAPGVEDCWGRALWGLGTAASRGRDPQLADRALAGFHLSAALRSPWPHAMAFAGLGAAEVLRRDSGDRLARSLLADAARAVTAPAGTGTLAEDPAWPWPQPRLTYANAVIPDVLLAAGDALNDADLVEHGLALLGWLLDVEAAPGHLSVTPTGGWAPGEPRPGFDQQPIEVSTLTDACARAYELTGAARWARGVELGAAWFHGANDNGSLLADDVSGGCCDGLQARGRNENQGAESTLALVSTLQHAHRLLLVG